MTEEEFVTVSQDPEVRFLILADRAEVVNGKLYMMGGGWDQVRVADFGRAVSLGIALGVDVPWLAANRQHTWRLTIESSEDVLLAEVEGTFVIGRPATLEYGTNQQVPLAVSLPLGIPGPGTYSIVVSLNGREAARARFRAVALRPST